MPSPVLEKLREKQLASARDFARAKVPDYTPDDFQRDFIRGIDFATSFAALANPGAEAYARNCHEIREKIEAILLK